MKIQNVIDNNMCISCGLCTYQKSSEMIMKKGIYLPHFNKSVDVDDEFFYNVCPGKGYNIVSLGKELYGKYNKYDYKIGYYCSYGAARTLDKDFIKNSSSGGMMPYLAFYLLEEKIVDGILTVKFEYTENGPKPMPFIAKTKDELISAQGSKYMPVPLFQEIDDIIGFPGKLAVIGTPCQIAGLRLLQKKNNEVNNKIKITIANFCGGYRDYRETERIFDIFKINKEKVSYFSYRGNGQPGTMTIEQNDRRTNISYPEYARLTGYTKYYRCRLCVDATGELADISFGDAWHPKFINTKQKWSFYICRSETIETILRIIKEKNGANFQQITLDDLTKSQKGNLVTKKERQNSRYRLYKILKLPIPNFDGGYNQKEVNIKFELKVFLSQKIMYFLEKVGLYLLFAKILKRVNKKNYEI